MPPTAASSSISLSGTLAVAAIGVDGDEESEEEMVSLSSTVAEIRSLGSSCWRWRSVAMVGGGGGKMEGSVWKVRKCERENKITQREV